MPPARNYTNPVSYKTAEPKYLGVTSTATHDVPFNLKPPIAVRLGARVLLTSSMRIAGIKEDNKHPTLKSPTPSGRQSIRLTTYPPVYRTILGADKPTGEFTNIFRTPRVFPPLQGTKNT